MTHLSVNIDHIATLRNARGGIHPDPIALSHDVLEGSGDGITVHLREDRRHIRDEDVSRLRHENILPLTLEMAATQEMLDIALAIQPKIVCFVPEKRQELTTEGGLALDGSSHHLEYFTRCLRDADIDVSFFINPQKEDIVKASSLGASIVELHTGHYCTAYDTKSFLLATQYLKKLEVSAHYAKSLGLEVHAGHGLTRQSVGPIAAIPEIQSLNIGHAIIGDALSLGLRQAVRAMKAAILEGKASQKTVL
jgi:pyridoxine 5-phosphate synthase